MSCKEFANIVNDLAHGRIMDAAARDCGLAHAQVCANCAELLGNERTVSALLRALAAGDEEKSAPSAIESVLIDAFRQNAVKGTAGSRQVRLRRVRWALAAAAMILLALGAFGLAARLGIERPPTNQGAMVKESSSPPDPVPGKAGEDLTGEREKKTAGQEPRTAAARPQEKRYPKASHYASARPRTRQVLIRDEMTLYAGDADVVTDFIPLTDGDSLKRIERGELIRVHMPRIALLKFGLPMNVEHAGVPVKADLLIGDDGLAHAIRFVR
jgi:hypothetical protein